MATSAPVPIATPRSAAARAGASLMPSPTMATTLPRARSSSTTPALSPGSTWARTRSGGIPTCAATARAVARWSPVTSQASMPAASRARTASADSGFTGSAIASSPAGRAVDGHEDRRPPVGCLDLAGRLQVAEVDAALGEEAGAPDEHEPPVDRRPGAAARGRLERSAAREGEPALARGQQDRPGDRMLGAGLDGRGQAKQVVGREVSRRAAPPRRRASPASACPSCPG